MKNSFLILVLSFTIHSCERPAPVASLKKERTEDLLIGEWGISSFIHSPENSMSVPALCNSCPVLVFDPNHIGFVKSEVGDLYYYFSWFIEKEHLVIKHPANDKDKMSNYDGTFQIIFPDKKNHHRMDLLNNVKHVKYMLNG